VVWEGRRREAPPYPDRDAGRLGRNQAGRVRFFRAGPSMAIYAIHAIMPAQYHGGEAMPTRNVVLTAHHEKVIKRLVKSGRYQNASEVLRDGIRLVQQREAEDAEKLKALREAAREGWKSIERGDYIEFEDFDELDRYLRKRADKIVARSAKHRG